MRDTWTDRWSIEHKGYHGKTMSAVKDSMVLFLKTVFTNNAAKDIKFYMTALKSQTR